MLSIHEYNTNTAPAKYVVVFGLKFEDIFVNTAGTTKSTLQRMKIFAVYYVVPAVVAAFYFLWTRGCCYTVASVVYVWEIIVISFCPDKLWSAK